MCGHFIIQSSKKKKEAGHEQAKARAGGQAQWMQEARG